VCFEKPLEEKATLNSIKKIYGKLLIRGSLGCMKHVQRSIWGARGETLDGQLQPPLTGAERPSGHISKNPTGSGASKTGLEGAPDLPCQNRGEWVKSALDFASQGKKRPQSKHLRTKKR